MRKHLIALLLLSLSASFAHGAWYEKASDNFDRANGNLTTPWETITGQNPMKVQDNIATLNNVNQNNGSKYTGTSFGNNQYSQAYVAGGDATAAYHRLSVRIQSDSYSGYNFTFGATDTYLYRFDSGTSTTIGSATTATKAVGDLYRIEVTDNTIKCYRNGSEIISVVDNTYTSGSPSIEQYNGLAWGLDNWSGGDDVTPASSGSGGRSHRMIFIQ